MRYDRLKECFCEDFRRLTGVKPKTFGVMPGVLRPEQEMPPPDDCLHALQARMPAKRAGTL